MLIVFKNEIKKHTRILCLSAKDYDVVVISEVYEFRPQKQIIVSQYILRYSVMPIDHTNS